MAGVARGPVNHDKLMMYRDKILDDLRVKLKYRPASKDICIVVHNGLDYIRDCLESIEKNTDPRVPYTVWVWDNASGPETRDYLVGKLMNGRKIRYSKSATNMGFIEPANALAAAGDAPYVIMLNSDTVVSPGWDEAMIAHLQQDDDLAQVGFQGGILNERGMGLQAGHGRDVDYINGWCFAIRRQDFTPDSLFDSENLSFAYGEDSDLSLRLRERGRKIYALHLDLVQHFENKTVLEVAKDEEWQRAMRVTFEANHEYIRRRWGDYLAHHRFGLHQSPSEL